MKRVYEGKYLFQHITIKILLKKNQLIYRRSRVIACETLQNKRCMFKLRPSQQLEFRNLQNTFSSRIKLNIGMYDPRGQITFIT